MPESQIERPAETVTEPPATVIYLRPAEGRWAWAVTVGLMAIASGLLESWRYGGYHWTASLVSASILLGLGVPAHLLMERRWGRPRLELSTRGVAVKRRCIGDPVMYSAHDIRGIEVTATRVLLDLEAQEHPISIPLPTFAIAQTVKSELQAFSTRSGVPLR